MLAPLGFFLVNLLISCTLALLLCRALDSERAAIEASQTRLAHQHTITECAPTFLGRVGVRIENRVSLAIGVPAAPAQRGQGTKSHSKTLSKMT